MGNSRPNGFPDSGWENLPSLSQTKKAATNSLLRKIKQPFKQSGGNTSLRLAEFDGNTINCEQEK
jgi:hypothetical protein